jgi:hypothetical protein
MRHLLVIAALFIMAAPFAQAASIHDAMAEVGDAYKTLGKGLRRPDPADHAEYLAAAQKLQLNLVMAKDQAPEKAGGDPEQITLYRSIMAKTLLTAVKLEIALLDQDYEAAGDLVKALKALKGKGHDKFE